MTIEELDKILRKMPEDQACKMTLGFIGACLIGEVQPPRNSATEESDLSSDFWPPVRMSDKSIRKGPLAEIVGRA